MLSFQSVTKRFQLDEDVHITPVNRVDFEVCQGELIIIVGRSGTGKSTLLNLAAGLIKPNEGTVSLRGRDLSQMSDKQLSEVRNREMGFIFQFPSLIPSLSVLENIALPASLNGNNNFRNSNRALELLEVVGLKEKAGAYPSQLSAGEQKRVVIARSLINDPRLVLADEPTSDLDEYTERQIMEMLKHINEQGITFLMVTHSSQLLPLATKAFEMNAGTLTLINARQG